MSKLRVGVLRGGASSKYDESLRSGQHLLKLLRHDSFSDDYEPIDIFVDKFGLWHINGAPHDPSSALKKVDVIFNALHEDQHIHEDSVQKVKTEKILDSFNMPYVGAGHLASSLAKSLSFTKDKLKERGIKTPYAKEIFVDEAENVEASAYDIFRSFPMPVVVRPKGVHSVANTAYASNFAELIAAINQMRTISPDLVFEEYITGKEIISGAVQDMRGAHPYITLPVEHRRTEGEKKNGTEGALHDAASRLSESDKAKINDAMKTIFEVLDLKQYATATFVVSPSRGVTLMKIDTHPEMHESAPLWDSLELTGIRKEDFIRHVIALALKEK